MQPLKRQECDANEKDSKHTKKEGKEERLTIVENEREQYRAIAKVAM